VHNAAAATLLFSIWEANNKLISEPELYSGNEHPVIALHLK